MAKTTKSKSRVISQTTQKPYLEKAIIQSSEIVTFSFKRGKLATFSFETTTFDPFYLNLILLIFRRNCHVCYFFIGNCQAPYIFTFSKLPSLLLFQAKLTSLLLCYSELSRLPLSFKTFSFETVGR